MNESDIRRARLRAQGIEGPGSLRPEEAVRKMGAVQAQDQNQANWAVGLRTDSGTLIDVERALQDAKIVLSWPNRGTLHYVHVDDARWLLGLLAPRNLARAARRLDELGLDHQLLSKAEKVLERSLSGGRRMERHEVLGVLADNGIDPSGQRGYHIVWYLGQKRFLCFGPRNGKSQTFVLFDEWVPPGKGADPEEALCRLAQRYFAGHGPATRKDFAKWAGITERDARFGIEAGEAELERATILGTELIFAAQSPPPSASVPGRGYLLPGFDEYLLGYRDRSAVLEAAHADRVAPGGNGMFRPMIVLDGHIVGTWSRRVFRDHLEIELEGFAGYQVDRDMFIQARDDFSFFTGATCELSVP